MPDPKQTGKLYADVIIESGRYQSLEPEALVRRYNTIVKQFGAAYADEWATAVAETFAVRAGFTIEEVTEAVEKELEGYVNQLGNHSDQ